MLGRDVGNGNGNDCVVVWLTNDYAIDRHGKGVYARVLSMQAREKKIPTLNWVVTIDR